MLIAEDDMVSRIILQGFLRKYGSAHVAVNGKEAVKAVSMAFAEGEPYDLICLDIMMPEMDGRAALEKIRAIEEGKGISSSRGAKILMTTALGDPKNVVQSFRNLCDGYLVKPIRMADLEGELVRLNLIRSDS